MTTDSITADNEDGVAERPAREPYLFVAINGDRPHDGGARVPLARVDELVIGRGPKLAIEQSVVGSRRSIRLSLAARALSTVHARLVRVGREWVLEDAGSRNGTVLDARKITRAPLADGSTIELGGCGLVFEHRAASAPTTVVSGGDLLATTVPDLERRHDNLRRIAPTTVPVLIHGRTGTGKEVAARAIHELSNRSGPFVAVNCGALPQGLVEGQLFGHERGAFSGAVRAETGFVRAANRGTLFLDEIGDLAPAAQTTLLRVLQEREVIPIGSTRAHPVDVRVIAATHRTLAADVDAGRFRPDLYARLRGFVFETTPLGERMADLGLIVSRYLPADLRLSARAVRDLLAYEWPYNIRELRQVIEVGMALARDGVIGTWHGIPSIDVDAPPPEDRGEDEDAERLRTVLLAQLREHRGNVAAVSRAMNKAPMQIRRWMKRFEIDAEAFRTP